MKEETVFQYSISSSIQQKSIFNFGVFLPKHIKITTQIRKENCVYIIWYKLITKSFGEKTFGQNFQYFGQIFRTNCQF